MEFRAPACRCAIGLASILLAGGCAHASVPATERVYLPSAAINRQFVRAIFDTGFGTTDLCEPAANKLGVKFTSPVWSPDEAPNGLDPALSEPLELAVGPQVLRAQLPVIRVAWGVGREDLIVGWPDVHNNVLIFDGDQRTITAVDAPPPETIEWQKFRVLPTTGANRTHGLCLLIPLPHGKNGVLMVDTGSDHGVALAPAHWKEWLAAHPHAPTTPRIYYNVYGEVIKTEAWADQLGLGDLSLTDIPVREADTVDEVTGPDFIGTLGLFALKRLDLVVDGVNNVAYVRTKTTPAPAYPFIKRPGDEAKTPTGPIGRRDWTVLGDLHVDGQQLAMFAALLKFSAHDYDGALVDFSHAIDADPQDADAYRYRALIRISKGAQAAAIADFTRAIELEPGRAQFYFERGKARLSTGDGPGAVADFTHGIEVDPQNVDAYVNRGTAKIGLHDFLGALADFNQALALDPDRLSAYVDRGNAHNYQGDFDDAIADYSRAVKLDPKFALAYANRGVAKLNQRDYLGAIADLDTGLKLDPADAGAFINRGTAKLNLQDYDGAISDFDYGLRLDPTNAVAYANRGAARGQLGDYRGEIADATSALALDSDFALAYANRAFAYLGRSAFDDAQADLSHALKITPGHPDFLLLRGQVSLAQGRFAAAAADFANVLQSNPDSLEERCLLVVALRRSGQNDAGAGLPAALATLPESWNKTVGLFLTGSLSELNLLVEATRGDSATLHARQCAAFYYAGELRLLQNDASGARSFFAKSLDAGETLCPEYTLASAELMRLTGSLPK